MTRSTRMSAAALAVALLAGCAAIPSSSQVNEGIQFSDASSVELDILARGPQDGDSQEEILQGFLAAAASPQLDFRIARQFLSSDCSKKWRPDSGTVVDQAADRAFAAAGESSVSLLVRPVATVSDDGVYANALTPATEVRNYEFVSVDGQWRIQAAPQGIVIDETTFGIVFGSYALQFFSPDGQYFVPDLRWFARREATQTAIVRAVLAGPSDWLAPGVVSAVPVGTRLDADTVPVSGATAVVNLALDSVPAPAVLSRFQAQLTASLAGVGRISAVTLSINGTAENVSALEPMPALNPRVDARPAVLTDAGFGYVSSVSGQVERDAQLSGPLLSVNPDAISLGLGGTIAAVRTASGVSRVTAAGSQPVWTGAGWLAPSIDPLGGIWSAVDGARIFWQGPQGNTAEFASLLGDSGLVALAVSRDGTRLAELVRTNDRVRFVVSAIARGPDGSPAGLGSPVVAAETSGTGLALSWVDPRNVAFLVADAGTQRIVVAELGGRSTVRAAPTDSTTIAVGNGAREIRIRDGANQLLQPAGAAWQLRGVGIRVLANQTGVR